MHRHRKLATMLGWLLSIGLVGDLALAQSGRTPVPRPVGEVNPLPNPDPNLDARDSGACARTSTAAYRACQSEINDEYWIAYGNCQNLTDLAARRQCLAEARAALDEAEQDCRDQDDARAEVCDLVGEGPYDPEILAANFLTPAQAAINPNPFFPLVFGRNWQYTEGTQTVDVTVTCDTKVILDVTCFVVRDVVRENGSIIEDTIDWYAVDVNGNVWYMGEHSETWEDGELINLDGSWQAGRDGAKAGIIMKASPQLNDAYRQEFLLGDAEDIAIVINTNGTETVPMASCDGDCVVTRDITALEPGSGSDKYYAQNVGLILGVDLETGEREELVGFTPGVPCTGTAAQARSLALLSPVRVSGVAGGTGASVTSTIRFDLARDANLNVDVYDAAGRRVQSLFAGRQPAGSHAFEWRGTDAGGRRVANGIYFVRVRAGAESGTGRVAVLAR